jgi:hypothetical protein
MNIWGLQDAFHDAKSDEDRDKVRRRMCDLGFHGVAATIRPVSEGGTDWRRQHAQGD